MWPEVLAKIIKYQHVATPYGSLGWLVYGRIWRVVSISRGERPVKLISAVKRAENREIGAGILDLCIFESIIGNTASEGPSDRPAGQSTDRQNLSRGEVYRPSFRPLPHSTVSPPFVSDPINSYHIHVTFARDAFSERKLAGETHSRIVNGGYDRGNDAALSTSSTLQPIPRTGVSLPR